MRRLNARPEPVSRPEADAPRARSWLVARHARGSGLHALAFARVTPPRISKPAPGAARWAGALLACLSLAFTAPAWALFEDLPPNPRALALGEAMTSFVDDAWAYYYNPAMLPWLEELQAGVSTVQPNGLDFNRQTALAVASRL